MLYTYLYHFSLHGKGSGLVAVIPKFSATIVALSSSVIDIFSSASLLSLIGSIFLMPVSQSSMIDPSTNLNVFKFIWLSSLNTLSSTS